MRGGVWVLNIMAVVWVAAGLLSTGQPLWWLAVPVATSVGLTVWARQATRDVTPGLDGGHVGRVVGIWIAIETVAIVITANVLANLNRVDALMPAIAIIVGLHFFGLAKGIPVRVYYATGAALIAVGIVALVAPPIQLPLATGVMSGLILWVSGIALIRDSR